MLDILEQKEVEVKGEKYLITAMGATEGLAHIKLIGKEDDKIIKDTILRHVSHQGIPFSEDKFNKHFSRKFTQVYDLYNEIVNFNFEGIIDSPNAASGM